MAEVKTLSQLLDLLSKGYVVSGGTVNPPLLRKAALEPKSFERSFCITVAGHTIEIHSRFRDIYILCKKYISKTVPDLQISISDEELDFERNKESKRNVSWPDSYLETLAILRKTSELMLTFDTFLMHGAVVAVNNAAFMFTADSGIGKTTHINKWLQNLDNAYVVNGDKPFLQVVNSQIIAYGTPWCGKEGMGMNTMVPLKAIVLMERGESNIIKEISFGQAYIFLLQQIYRPEDPDKMMKTLELLSQLNGKVRFYKYIFNNMKEDAFTVSYSALMGCL